MINQISNLVTGGFYREALLVYTRHGSFPRSPTKFTFPPLLKACAKLGYIVNGRLLHAYIIKTGFSIDVFAATAVMSMYMKLDQTTDALRVLDEMPDRNVATVNVAISGFLQNGCFGRALRAFREARVSGSGTNSVTVATALGGCEEIRVGTQMHCLAIKSGFETDVYVGTSLVSMYSRCKSWILAAKMFENMAHKSVVTYNAFLSGLLDNGVPRLVLDVFNLMRRLSSEEPNAVTFIDAISACTSLLTLRFGRQIHGLVMKTEFQFDAMVGTSLVDMYSKCHCWKSAFRVFNELGSFRNLITWNSMISGMMMNGQYEAAVELFEHLDPEGLEPDSSTWNSLISGFSQSGKGVEAFKFFRRMQSSVMFPSLKCITSLLPACSDLSALKIGKEIHGHAIRSAFEFDPFVATSLIDMYMKCGLSLWAQRIFDQFETKPRDPAFWNAMISGYGRNGEYESAIEIFDLIQEEKVEPSSATFVGVLSACSHCGKVEKGFQIFRSMEEKYRLRPNPEHISCVVDLLGRYGRLREAKELIDDMPDASLPSVLSALLGACRLHLDPVLGEEMVMKLSELEPENPTPLVILSSIYAALGRWQDVERTRQVIDHKRLIKHPGHSLAGVT